MRDCEEYRLWISAQLDGELGEAERRELRTHLGGCPDCAALYEAFSRVSAAMVPEELPEGLHGRIMAPVLASAPRKKAPWLLPALSAAACFIAVTAAVLIVRPAFLGGSGTAAAKSESAADTTAAAASAAAGAGADAGPVNGMFRQTDGAYAMPVPMPEAPAAAEEAATAAAPADAPGEAFMAADSADGWRETALLLRIGSASPEGVRASVEADPTALFPPGTALLLQLPEGEAPPQTGALVRADFDRWDSDGEDTIIYVLRLESAEDDGT